MLSELLRSHFDLATHIFSFLDSFTLLSCLEISSSFYAAATQKNVWKDRWLWRTNAHPDSGNLTYQQFRGIRNIEVEFLNQTYVSFKENSSQCPDDQVLESMSLLQLECLISFCEHSEVYHDSLSEFDRNSDLSHQNSQRFLGQDSQITSEPPRSMILNLLNLFTIGMQPLLFLQVRKDGITSFNKY
jgi:hypothetical protein